MTPGAPPFQAIAESTYDWEMWIDATGAVRWVNATVARFTGHSPEACASLPDFPFCVVHEDDREVVRTLFAGAREGTSGNDVELRVLHLGGGFVWAAISWQPLKTADRSGGFRTSIRDIHERKLAEERLRVAERRAAQLAQERTEFLASLSHELRSPLHCIAGFAELLGRGPLDESKRPWVGIVHEQSHAVLRLVEDLLQFVAGEREELTLREDAFDLARVVRSEVDAARARLRPEVALRFIDEVQSTDLIRGDSDRVRRVVANVVGNAMRFTERGSIDVVIEPGEAGRRRIVVRDTGIGMSEDLVARVRAPYVQGSPTASASRGGVGLGLAIVDQLLEGMGGELEIRSVPGTGTCVVATIPVAPAPAAQEAEGTPLFATALAGPPLVALVVDDSAPARELLVAMLADFGVGAMVATSGEDAVRVARACVPDLVIIDYHMPGFDGLATARALRDENVVSPRAKVVLLTANVFVGRGPEWPAGVDEIERKPMRLARLGRLLSEARTRRDAVDPIDHEVLDELVSIVDAEGRTLLSRRGSAMLQAIREAVVTLESTDDSNDLRRCAHELVGLAASLGARELAETVRNIERGASAGEDTCALRTRLRAVLVRTEHAIEASTGLRL